MDWLRIEPGNTPLKQLHQYIIGSIAPRPIAFASTVDMEGIPNLAPFSFFNAFGSNPPTVAFSPARSGRTGLTKDTFNNIKSTGEVTINAVSYDMVEQMVLASTEYPAGVNEFEKAGFTPVPSEMVKPPRVGESAVQMECKVKEIIETGNQGGAGNIIICEILLIHIHPRVLDDDGMIDPQKIQLVGRLGRSWYCKAFGDSLFSIPSPGNELGIGFDRLPEQVRTSKVLTGNKIAKMARLTAFPGEDLIASSSNQAIKHLGINDLMNARVEEIHLLAAEWIDREKIEEALALLLAYHKP